MMDLTQFLLAECLPVVAVLYVIGALLKSTPKIPDWTIPYILLVLSPAMTIGVMIPLAGWVFDYAHMVQGVIQGVICTGLAVFGNQMIKQGTKGLMK